MHGTYSGNDTFLQQLCFAVIFSLVFSADVFSLSTFQSSIVNAMKTLSNFIECLLV